MSVTRRGFVKGLSLSAVPWLGFPHVIGARESGAATPGEKPRRIIHIVADGMSTGTLTCADHFSLLDRERNLAWIQLQRRPETVLAWVDMRSLNSLVTDSAAASSSWGSGSRVANGAVNWLPDGRALRPLYSLFADQSWKRGLVTTTEITHATPAGFATHVSDRDKAEDIAAQYLEQKIEVLIGGGQKFFDQRRRKDKRDLFGEFKAQGYTLCRTANELRSSPADQRCLGVFTPSHLPFAIDLVHDNKQRAVISTLAEMTRIALDHLHRESRFILQVEGGRVDHASHNCDIAAAIHEILSLDEAIEVCLEYQLKVPETLIVLTVDHGNGNPGLNGSGDSEGSDNRLIAHLKQAQKSFPEILKPLSRLSDPEKIRNRLLETTGYDVSLEKAGLFADVLQKRTHALNDSLKSISAQLGQLLGNYYGIGWASGAHTSDYVPLLAIGPGAERFRGFLKNTDVFDHYLALAKIDFHNPQLPLTSETQPAAAKVEDIASYLEPNEFELA
jgi:alkaline phosphatase